MRRSLFFLLCALLLIPNGALAQNETGASAAQFSGTVFERLREENPGNFAFSPLSLYTALSILSQGADGETRAQLAALLGDQAAEDAAEIQSALSSTSGNTQFNLANGLFIDKGFQVSEEFANGVRESAKADLFFMDFLAENPVPAINAWVNEKTRGLIPKVLDDKSDVTTMFIVNTLYFNARWMRTFDPFDTERFPFRAADGETPIDMLTMTTDLDHFIETDDLIGALLPYDDDRFALLAVKPRSGKLSDVKLGGDTIISLIKGATAKENVELRLPKFTAKSHFDLKETLKAIGMTDAFDPELSDLTKLGRSTDNLYVGKIVQDVFLRVDEEGTEAAAATTIGVDAACIQMEEPFLLAFDSPFLYAVVDMETGLPLFMGQMTQA